MHTKLVVHHIYHLYIIHFHFNFKRRAPIMLRLSLSKGRGRWCGGWTSCSNKYRCKKKVHYVNTTKKYNTIWGSQGDDSIQRQIILTGEPLKIVLRALCAAFSFVFCLCVCFGVSLCVCVSFLFKTLSVL